MCRRFVGPAVYRWSVFDKSGEITAAYVGQAEHLVRRLQGYISPRPSQQTNIRIRKLLDAAVKQGFSVRFEVVVFEDFIINNHAYGFEWLNDPFRRKVIENLAVLEHYGLNCEIWNIGKNIVQKRLESATSPKQFRNRFNALFKNSARAAAKS
jgi:hypothetical protein